MMYSTNKITNTSITNNQYFPSFRLKPLTLSVGLILTQPALAADYLWTTGSFSAEFPGISSFSAADTFEISPGGTKFLDTTLTSAANTTVTDTLYFESSVLNNNGLFNFENSSNLSDYSGSAVFNNNGVFEQSGGGTTNVQVTFTNTSTGTGTGVIEATSGVINFTNNDASFNNNSVFTNGGGSGVINVNSNATFTGAFTSNNLYLNNGTFNGVGAEIAGSVSQPNSVVEWTGGALAGAWTLDANQNLNLQSGNTKFLEGSLVNNGVITANDHLYFDNATLTNNNQYIANGSVNLYDWAGSALFTNNSLFEKSGSGSTTNIDVTFTNNSGHTIQADAGTTLNFANGDATFNNNTAFTGTGAININNSATFVGNFTNNNNLTFSNGTYTAGNGTITSATLAGGSLNWTGGTLLGNWNIDSGLQLNLNSGNTKFLEGNLVNNGVITANDHLYFDNATLTNNNQYIANGGVNLYDWAGSALFTNNGLFEKSGSGSTTNIGLTFINNSGYTIQADAGTTLNFANGDAIFNNNTAFTGTGAINVNNSATFVGNFTDNNNLTFSNGTYTAGNGAITSATLAGGSLNWTGGTLLGNWNIDSGLQLNINSGNTKFLEGNLINNGVITANDHLYFDNATLTNNNQYIANGGVNLYDWAGSAQFTNNGVFEKSGTGSSTSINLTFTNNSGGTIQTDAGNTLNFANGDAIFNNNTAFTGTGAVNFTNSATFVGNFTDNNNLTLSNGTFTGGNSPTTSATLAGGSLNWTGGTLTGNWNIATGQQLGINTGNTKFLTGSVINNGNITANDHLYFENASLTNNGQYTANGNVNLYDYAGSGSFVNNGVFVKSGGTTDASTMNFSNTVTGDVEIQSGSVLDLANGFDNQGLINLGAGATLTIAGNGNFTSEGTVQGIGGINGNLTDTGTILPGTVGTPGTLTINGNYQQNSGGIFNEQLGSTFGLLDISGNATFNGGLKLTAVSGLNLSLNENIVIAAINGSLTSGYFGGNTIFTDSIGDVFKLSQTTNGNVTDLNLTVASLAAVPVPGAVWLFCSGLLGFIGMSRKTKSV